MTLLVATDRGLYCAAGDFFIDPWAPVPRAVVTHAHGDHLTPGSEAYLVAEPGRRLAEQRLGGRAVDTITYGETRTVGDVSISMHPAGHILGSAQIRLEHRGEVWVVSGDYKTDPDPTCAAFEPLRCHTFITESTFGLPIYRWPAEDTVRAEILAWHEANRAAGRASILFAYPLGKSQRLLAIAAGLRRPDLDPRRSGNDDRTVSGRGCRTARHPPGAGGVAQDRMARWIRAGTAIRSGFAVAAALRAVEPGLCVWLDAGAGQSPPA